MCSLDGILLERKTFGSKRPLAILIDFQVKILLSQDNSSINALVENSKHEQLTISNNITPKDIDIAKDYFSHKP